MENARITGHRVGRTSVRHDGFHVNRHLRCAGTITPRRHRAGMKVLICNKCQPSELKKHLRSFAAGLSYKNKT